MSNIVESLYRLAEAMPITDKFTKILNSQELISKLEDKFGKGFNTKPICSEVSKEVVDLLKSEGCYSIEAISGFITYAVADNFKEVLDTANHTVVKYEGTIYDFTNQQYMNHKAYSKSLVNTVPVVFEKVENGKYSAIGTSNNDELVIEEN